MTISRDITRYALNFTALSVRVPYCLRGTSRSYSSSVFAPDYDLPPSANDTTKLREPRGYVASHRWLQMRPPQQSVQDFLFGAETKASAVDSKYMSAEIKATVTGAPVKDGLDYPVFETVSGIPRLSASLAQSLSAMGLNELTPVQRHAISIMSYDETVPVPNSDSPGLERVVGQYDLMAAAQTGSGKTLAYLIPVMNRMLRVYPYEAMQSVMKTPYCQFPSGLVLAPTRELVHQIRMVACQLAYRSFLRPVALFGGERPMRQQRTLADGCHLVIATPGRLLDFLSQGLLSLEHCRSLVLDEADRMLDMGFEEDLRRILETPAHRMPQARDSERQTCLFSATFPQDVTQLARSFLRGPRCISLSVTVGNVGAIVPEWGKAISKQSKAEEVAQLCQVVPREISQEFQMVEANSPFALSDHVRKLIRNLLSEDTSRSSRILVFSNTKFGVDQLDRALHHDGLRVSGLHGDKSQDQRSKALDRFRRGLVDVLVASSVAARGLDIPSVSAVINVGIPTTADDYVHRIGRTGRMGNLGRAITVVDRHGLSQTSSSTVRHILNIVRSSVGSLDSVPHPIRQHAEGNVEGKNATKRSSSARFGPPRRRF